MKIDFNYLDDEVKAGVLKLKDFLHIDFDESGVKISKDYFADGLKIQKNGEKVVIACKHKSMFFRGLGILSERADENEFEEVQLFQNENLALMFDCSRNGVFLPSAICDFAKHATLCGYTQIQLYIEDVYDVPEEKGFGNLRGKYTKAEIQYVIKELKDFGLELVPCIQTLAHLEKLLKRREYFGVRDRDGILLIDSERTYELLENCIRAIADMFESKKINIGMDESVGFCTGAYAGIHGEKDQRERCKIFIRHLTKVLEICEKYELKASMWADMFFNLFYGSKYNIVKKENVEEFFNLVPRNVELIFWDYYPQKREYYETRLQLLKNLGDNVGFAGNANCYLGQTPFNQLSVIANKRALPVMRKQKIKNVVITVWGDGGQEASRYSVIPNYILCAELLYGQSIAKNALNRRCKTCFGITYDDAMLFDIPNENYDKKKVIFKETRKLPSGLWYENRDIPIMHSATKYSLYSDLFVGVLDALVMPNANKYYTKAKLRLGYAAKRNSLYKYVFEALRDLCACLEIKYDLGYRLRKNYQEGNRDGLYEDLKLIEKLLPRLRKLQRSVEIQWFKENKPFGYEVLDVRLNGLLGRIQSAKKRLQSYLNGEIEKIDELEETVAPITGLITDDERYRDIFFVSWCDMVTAGQI